MFFWICKDKSILILDNVYLHKLLCEVIHINVTEITWEIQISYLVNRKNVHYQNNYIKTNVYNSRINKYWEIVFLKLIYIYMLETYNYVFIDAYFAFSLFLRIKNQFFTIVICILCNTKHRLRKFCNIKGAELCIC